MIRVFAERTDDTDGQAGGMSSREPSLRSASLRTGPEFENGRPRSRLSPHQGHVHQDVKEVLKEIFKDKHRRDLSSSSNLDSNSKGADEESHISRLADGAGDDGLTMKPNGSTLANRHATAPTTIQVEGAGVSGVPNGQVPVVLGKVIA